MRLERLAQWLDAVAARPSVASTTPSPDYIVMAYVVMAYIVMAYI